MGHLSGHRNVISSTEKGTQITPPLVFHNTFS